MNPNILSANVPLHDQVLMYGDLNFKYKVKILLKQKQKSVPPRDLGYQALEWGIRANLIFSTLLRMNHYTIPLMHMLMHISRGKGGSISEGFNALRMPSECPQIFTVWQKGIYYTELYYDG